MTEEELGRQLDVHHKIPYANFKSNLEANKLEHLTSVCPACHTKLEAQLRRELPLFRQS
ncbi:MAG: HNH endonuclease [Candidatus Latescibacteria bacterium]|nr:HNH endonuclease [Candidatus Latescibacterota bacterium]